MYVGNPHPHLALEDHVGLTLGYAQLISFVAGYVLQDIQLALFIALGGAALTLVVVVPAWPFYNKSPVEWLPVRGPPPISVPQNVVIDEKAI